MAIEVKAPREYNNFGKFTIFLGGVIDQGAAPQWQKDVVEALSVYDNLLILNPRRDEWNSTWDQSSDNSQFVKQVNWELDGQGVADLNIYVFAPDEKTAANSKAPITLLEMGLYSYTNMLVVCPPGYYRKGNVDIVAERKGIPVYESVNQMLADLRYLNRTTRFTTFPKGR